MCLVQLLAVALISHQQLQLWQVLLAQQQGGQQQGRQQQQGGQQQGQGQLRRQLLLQLLALAEHSPCCASQ
jgi:hypothetical protein